jgi:hypothetical protein
LKAETKAIKEFAKASNTFNKVTDGGKKMIGAKSMVAGETLDKAKSAAGVARINTVKSQIVNTATKGPAGNAVNEGAQNTVIDKVKSFFKF